MAERDRPTTPSPQDESVPQGRRKESLLDSFSSSRSGEVAPALLPGNRVQFAAKYSHGRGGQAVLGTLIPNERRCDGRAVRIRVSFFPVRVPLILSLAECDHRDRSSERLISGPVRIAKHDMDLMRIVMVLIDKHERPLPIGALHRISRNQQVPLRVLYVASRSVELVFSIYWLRPLLRHQLCSKKLGRGLLDLIVRIHHKHVISSPTVGA